MDFSEDEDQVNVSESDVMADLEEELHVAESTRDVQFVETVEPSQLTHHDVVSKLWVIRLGNKEQNAFSAGDSVVHCFGDHVPLLLTPPRLKVNNSRDLTNEANFVFCPFVWVFFSVYIVFVGQHNISPFIWFKSTTDTKVDFHCLAYFTHTRDAPYTSVRCVNTEGKYWGYHAANLEFSRSQWCISAGR